MVTHDVASTPRATSCFAPCASQGVAGRYKDAMTRIDKQIADDDGDGEDDDDAASQRSDKLAAMCKKAKQLQRDTCEVLPRHRPPLV